MEFRGGAICLTVIIRLILVILIKLQFHVDLRQVFGNLKKSSNYFGYNKIFREKFEIVKLNIKLFK